MEEKVMKKVDEDVCPNCGAIVLSGDKFCDQCGHNMSSVVKVDEQPVMRTNSNSNPTNVRPGKVTFIKAIELYFTNYTNFSGRATLGEYWWIVLLQMIVVTIFVILANTVPDLTRVLTPIWSLATFLPSISVGVRRLHDVGKSGVWMLLTFTPVSIILAIFLARESAPDNEWGLAPIISK